MLRESKKFLSSLICLVMLIALAPELPVAAQQNASETSQTVAQGVCGDNVQWILDASGTLSITGSGAMKNYSSSSYVAVHAPWYQYRQDIKRLVIHSGITGIGSCAFYYCNSLTDITVPDSVTSIGYGAFRGCSSLKDVYISDLSAWCQIDFRDSDSTPMKYAKNLYLDNTLLTEAVISEDVTDIGNYAFAYCSSLTSISIPDSVTSIGAHTFFYCNLEDVYISDLGAWCQIDFRGQNANPMNRAKSLYLNNTLLTEAVIPEGVTCIGAYTFLYCRSLTDITIPDSVTSIGPHAFNGCSSLTGITIPGGVTGIGYHAFNGCSSLTDITIPDSVTSIGACAFNGCSSLTGITIPKKVTGIGYYTFYDCSSLTSISIPDSVTSIGELAFSGCSSLTSISIPDSVTRIDPFAFYGCSSLTSVTISKGMTSIGDSVFSSCSSLTDITIPDSVTSIGLYAFSGCSSLKTVKFIGAAPTFGESCFKNTNITAYHSCTDATWTDSVKQDYGGNITWVGHQIENGTCVLCGYVEDVTLSGSTTSFAAGAVTLTLTGNGIGETLTADTGSYTLTAAPGQYTLTVAQINHVTRQYAVTLESGNVTLDVTVHLIGDIDGNGKVNVGDVSMLNSHLKGTNLITDAYMLLCANINGSSLNMGDTAALYSHIKGTKTLY